VISSLENFSSFEYLTKNSESLRNKGNITCIYHPGGDLKKIGFDSALTSASEPKELANLIDKIVESKGYREKLAEEQFNFMNKVSDPSKVGEEWDKIFEELFQKFKSINKDTSVTVKFRKVYFLIINRLHFRKIKKIKKIIIQRIFK